MGGPSYRHQQVYNGTVQSVQNSLRDVLQLICREDGMDGAYIKWQCIETFHLNNWPQKFEHNYWVAMTDPAGKFLSGMLQAGINDSSLEFQALLDEEYPQLQYARWCSGVGSKNEILKKLVVLSVVHACAPFVTLRLQTH
jgi:RNA polymerase Rpb1, domain 6